MRREYDLWPDWGADDGDAGGTWADEWNAVSKN